MAKVHRKGFNRCQCSAGGKLLSTFYCGNDCSCCDQREAAMGKVPTSDGTTIYNPTDKDLRRKYSVLGGVVAPKKSAYTIMGMSNPLAERPTKALDTTRPSLTGNSAVSRFNNFSPYSASPRASREVINNSMAIRSNRNLDGIYVLNVNTIKPTGSPMLPNRFDNNG